MKVLDVVTDARTGETAERWLDVPGVMTVEEAAVADATRRADEARAERNRRLTACDWTALPDAPLGAAQKAEWAVYRQSLRDVTDQPGFPDALVWPEAVGARAQSPESA